MNDLRRIARTPDGVNKRLRERAALRCLGVRTAREIDEEADALRELGEA